LVKGRAETDISTLAYDFLNGMLTDMALSCEVDHEYREIGKGLFCNVGDE